MEFISINSSSSSSSSSPDDDDDDDDDDESLQHLFKSNIMKMNNNYDYFDEEEYDNVETLPVFLLSLFTRRTKREHQWLTFLDHV
jgi:hypothetical protein